MKEESRYGSDSVEVFQMIIDAHIHMYPPEIHRDPTGWARRVDEPYWALLIADRPDRPSIQGWATVERLLSDMDRAGGVFKIPNR